MSFFVLVTARLRDIDATRTPTLDEPKTDEAVKTFLASTKKSQHFFDHFDFSFSIIFGRRTENTATVKTCPEKKFGASRFRMARSPQSARPLLRGRPGVGSHGQLGNGAQHLLALSRSLPKILRGLQNRRPICSGNPASQGAIAWLAPKHLSDQGRVRAQKPGGRSTLASLVAARSQRHLPSAIVMCSCPQRFGNKIKKEEHSADT